MKNSDVKINKLTQDIINKVCILENEVQKEELFINLLNISSPTIISYINAHAFNLCYSQQNFANALAYSDFLFRDGKGIEILFKSIKQNPGLNMCGTDTIPQFLKAAKGKRIALLGTEDIYLNKASQYLISKGHDVVFTAHGFYDIQEYLPLLNNIKPEIIILGMGMPKQENLSIFLKERIVWPSIIINGGAIIDYWGGKVARAPYWIRNLGLEWIFRLLLEPRRLFKRYIIGNIIFLRRVKSFR